MAMVPCKRGQPQNAIEAIDPSAMMPAASEMAPESFSVLVAGAANRELDPDPWTQYIPT
jgi:hypothetical protein